LISDATVLSIFNQDGNMVKYYRWENIDTPILIDKIIDLNKIWNFYRIMIENNNQGLPIYQALRMFLTNIDSVNTNSKTKPEFINKLIHLFNMKEFKIVKDDYLRIELEGFIFKQTDTGIIRFMADSGFHDDCVMSMAIGRYCFEFYNRKKNATYLQGTDDSVQKQTGLLDGIVPDDMREFLF
jgi:predicted nucleic-acid-binding protein